MSSRVAHDFDDNPPADSNDFKLHFITTNFVFSFNFKAYANMRPCNLPVEFIHQTLITDMTIFPSTTQMFISFRRRYLESFTFHSFDTNAYKLWHGLCQPNNIQQLTHDLAVSAFRAFLIPEMPFDEQQKATRYLANEIDSMELNMQLMMSGEQHNTKILF